MGGKSGTKAVYFDKLKSLLDEYKSIFIASLSGANEKDLVSQLTTPPTGQRRQCLVPADARNPSVPPR